MPIFVKPKDDIINRLIRLQFPELPTFGAMRSMSDADWRAIQAGIEEYRAELEELSDDELQKLMDDGKALELERALAKQKEEEDQRHYNQPRAAADFAYWSRMSYWTMDEAVALSLGKDPRIVKWDNVKGLVRVSTFAAEYEAKRTLVERAVFVEQLWEMTYPNLFLAWAGRMKFEVPGALIDAVTTLGIQIVDWKMLYDEHKAGWQQIIAEKQSMIDRLAEACAFLREQVAAIPPVLAQAAEKPFRARERDSLLKLVIGMAVDAYGHDPKAPRSPTAQELADHLARLGIPLEADTVRKYLKEGAELMLSAETEKNG